MLSKSFQVSHFPFPNTRFNVFSFLGGLIKQIGNINIIILV